MEEERKGEIRRLMHAKRQCQRIAVMTHEGQYSYVASNVAGNGSTISQRKSGRDEAKRISCSMRKHVTEVKRGLINHIYRYNSMYLPRALDFP